MPAHSCRPGAGRARSGLEVADVIAQHIDDYRQRYALGCAERAVVRDLVRCRTAALGGHLDVCTSPGCGFERPAYNSCRNRHCPKCQGLSQARWVEQRMRRVLPTHYFHVVFTLPSELHGIARSNRALVFGLLLRCAAETLLTLGRDPKWLGSAAQLGVTTVLHTWTRELRFHPHAHCIVTGGGLALDGSRWVSAARDFLFPAHVLGALFRGKLLASLECAHRRGELVISSEGPKRSFGRRLQRLRNKSWVVYAKRPFGGPGQVHRYLGRYTHRVAISNARLVAADADGVTFRTRGEHTATVTPLDFLRRFFEHVLPKHFVKIRHYGLLASGNVTTRLARARALLAPESPASAEGEHDDVLPEAPTLLLELMGIDVRRCPRCKQPSLTRQPLVLLHAARAPPCNAVAA